MYEKTVAGLQRIYEVTLTGTPTRIFDLLNTTDKEEYISIIGEKFQSNNWNQAIDSRKYYRRTVVDGYIICPSSVMNVSTSLSGAQEPVPANVQYTNPVMFWTENLWVSGSGTAFVRIFFS
jgi:hypothetical protein